jgi:hypothetical protein
MSKLEQIYIIDRLQEISMNMVKLDTEEILRVKKENMQYFRSLKEDEVADVLDVEIIERREELKKI